MRDTFLQRESKYRRERTRCSCEQTAHGAGVAVQHQQRFVGGAVQHNHVTGSAADPHFRCTRGRQQTRHAVLKPVTLTINNNRNRTNSSQGTVTPGQYFLVTPNTARTQGVTTTDTHLCCAISSAPGVALHTPLFSALTCQGACAG